MNKPKIKWLDLPKNKTEHSRLFYLNNTTSSTNITGYYPYIIDLNPNFISNTNIYQIKYIVDNVEVLLVKFQPSTLSETDLSITTPPSIPHPLNSGDPRNYNFSHIFNNSSSTNLNHKVSALIYTKGSNQPSCNEFHLSLSSQNTLLGETSAGFFKDLTLIKHQMFGPNNDIIYFFQSESPNYILPVSVNWNNY